MRSAVRAGVPIVLSIMLAGVIIIGAIRATAQTTCPDGSSPATAADIPLMKLAGIPNPTVGTCWNKNDPNTGSTAAEAKQWLAQHATSNSNIACLNSQFAERLEALMKAVPGGVPTITDGYRSIAGEQKAIASGASRLKNACSGYHLYGLAADFNNSSKSTLQWMRLNAPRFGLAPTGVNPVTGCASSGFCDPGHIQIAGAIPAGMQCGVCDISGNGDLPSVSVPTDPDDALAPSGGPYYCVTSLNPPIAVQSQTPPGPGCLNNQQAMQPFQQPMMPIQPMQPLAPAAPATPAQPIQYQEPTNSLQNTLLNGGNLVISTSTATTSEIASNLLNSLTSPTTSTSTFNPGPVSLNVGNSIAQLQSVPIQSQVAVQTTNAPYIGAQQTFTSSDLSGGDGVTLAQSPIVSSPLAQILGSLKSALVGLLAFVQRL